MNYRRVSAPVCVVIIVTLFALGISALPSANIFPISGLDGLLSLIRYVPVNEPEARPDGPQIEASITTLGSPYTQNFDSLTNVAGTFSSTLPSGWALAESLANANTTYATGIGSSTTGDTYNFGKEGTNPDTDRAFGMVRSTTLLSTIGSSFSNATGATITSLQISYVGEEWRLGTAARTDQINFEYSIDATSLSTGTWTPVAALSFVTPNITTSGAKDGNAAENRTAIAATISGLSIPNGTSFWIRWTDFDATSSDDGLAVDDFSLTAQGDTTPPDTSITGGPSGSVSSTSATFTFTSTEAGSTFQCALDDAGFGACPVSYTGLSQASHTFQVRATDAAGNTDQTPASRTWTVDTVAPDTIITGGPSGTVTSTSATFTFTSTEAGSTFQCSLNGAGFGSCPAGYTGLAQGSHTFEVRAIDAAGNTDQTPASRTWTVDTVAPDTTITGGPSGTVASTSATFTFTSTEAGSTFECSLDGAGFGSCPTSYTGLTQASHTFQVRATDAAGNTDQTPASRTWTVDTIDPDTTITGGPTGTVFSTSASFTFSSTEAGSTFECRLDGAAFSACPVGYIGLSLGSHTFEVRATDQAGNTDQTPASRTWSVAAPTISINDVTLNEGNSGTVSFVFTVSLSNQSSDSITVNFVTANGTAAIADGDYTSASGTVTFAPLQTTQTVSVLVNGDTNFEPNETFTVNLSGGSDYTIAGSDLSGIGTIVNDDAQPAISVNNVTVTEGNSGTTAMTFTVSLSNASSQAITVNFATSNGTAAVADNDYQAASGTVTFAPLSTSQTVFVTINGDTKFENNETFSLNLSSPVNATLGTGTGTGTISNDDATPILTIDDVSLTEGNSGTSTMTFTVALSTPSGASTTVNYATVNGTATTANGDYIATSGTATIVAGLTSQTIFITINGDTTFETDETFTINLSGGSGYTAGDMQGQGTINNDDAPPTVSVNSATVTEGNSGTTTMTFNVTLASPISQTVTVDYATANTTATTADGDYVAASGTLTFPPLSTSQTVNVTINSDTKFESNETLSLNLASPVNTTLGSNGTGTINNDDIAPTLTINDVALTEGNSGTSTMTFTVSLSIESGVATSVNHATVNGAATAANGDYTATAGTLTIPAGSTSGTIGVTINGDATIEADETFTVNLSGGSGYTAGDMQGEGTILNDDAPLVLIVDNLADDIDLDECTASDNDCSLRGANSIANDGDTIIFAPGVLLPEAAPTIELAGQIVITQDLTITGPGANALIVQNTSEAGATSRIFQVDAEATVMISGLTLTGGNTTGDGGAISNFGNLALANVIITGNSAGATNANGGGGIANQGTITITSSTISGNAATGGGGGLLMVNGGTANIIGSTFSANTSGGGGAILSQAISLPANLTITNSTISGNTGPPCSGVWNLGAMATATVTSSTITNNVAGNGSLCAFGPTTIRNTIVVHNQNVATDADTSGAFISQGHNLIGNIGTATGFTGVGDQIGGGANPVIDLKLGPLANNGGPTFTHKPQNGFPGQDKGCAFGSTTDQRAMQRVIDWPNIPNGLCDGTDIGSVELVMPTAGEASISGRVLTVKGAGVANVTVTIRNMAGESAGTAVTNTFGYFTVGDLATGASYVVSVTSKGYGFEPFSQIVTLDEDVSDLNFIARPVTKRAR